MLLVIGSDDALLEGLAQALATAGHRVVACRSLEDAADLARREAPVMVIVERAFIGPDADRRVAHIPIAAGGALVTYHTAEEGPADVSLTPAMARLQLADLELPLERARLVALAAHVTVRSRKVGRPTRVRPPETPAL